MKIGNIEFKNKICVAPMAGVTDLAYRLICKKFEPALMTTELVSAEGIFRNSPGNAIIMKTIPKERPVALQLFGSDAIIMSAMANRMKDNFDIIDINMGCPVPKICRNHEGAALMNDIDNARRIVETMVRVVDKPVSVKMRIGWTKKTINAVQFAKMLEEAGASFITVHARSRDEYYSGSAHWDILKEVKDAVKIPVIGNGDVTTAEAALKMLNETKVDAVAIGRGIMGNPWLIRECIAITENKPIPPRPNIDEIKNIMIEHLGNMLSIKGEHIAILEMRKHFAWYVKGMPNASKLKTKVNTITTLSELYDLINLIE